MEIYVLNKEMKKIKDEELIKKANLISFMKYYKNNGFNIFYSYFYL